MADTEVLWRGLSIGGGGPYHVEEITGWDDLETDDGLDERRARAAGEHVGPQYAVARIVTITGSIATRSGRDALAQALRAATPASSDLEDLTIETFGMRLTTKARLRRRSIPVGDDYPSGKVPFSLQFKCPDPIRYGTTRRLSTGLPTSGGGMVFPLFASGGMDFGTLGQTGQLELDNPGDTEVPIRLEVRGGLPMGWEVSARGRRLYYPVAVPSGQVIYIDTGEGTVLAEGTADRSQNLVVADWLTVPAADRDGTPGSLPLQFTSLGGAFDPIAQLTAEWAPGY